MEELVPVNKQVFICPASFLGCVFHSEYKPNLARHLKEAVANDVAKVEAGVMDEVLHPQEMVDEWMEKNIQPKYIGADKRAVLMHKADRQDLFVSMLKSVATPYPKIKTNSN